MEQPTEDRGSMRAQPPPPDTKFVKRPRGPMRPRLTVQGVVYYQYPDGPPVQSQLGYSRACESDESPYQRTFVVGPHPARLELGWLEGKPVALVCFRHRGAAGEPEVEVSVGEGVDGFLIGPGESLPCRPRDPASLRLICRGGVVKVAVTAIPA